jgi:hypothetical protein
VLARTLRLLTGTRGDRIASSALLGLPLLVFAVPAAAGRLVTPGDDLIQNLPLRVLVGADLAHGHLPLLDPYLWSGAPLLAGWNAGAGYPLTWLFALLPASLAWTAGLVVTWWVAAAGLYVFVRSSPASSGAAFLAAFSFAFGGAMTAQVSHLGLVEGMSWVPWALVALRTLASSVPRTPAHRLAVAGLLGVMVALVVLAGEPRAVDDAAVTLGVYTLWRLARAGSVAAAGRLAGWVLGAIGLGVALSALQWLPGLDALHASQRSSASYSLYAYESLPARWLGLLAVPDLLGGSGSFGAPSFLGGPNLVEYTGYCGMAALGAAAGLLGRLRRHRPGSRALPEWFVWEILLLVGILLSLGASTPLGHVLAALPLYGSQRIQARNLLEVDLALALLLGAWVDGFVAAARPGGQGLPSVPPGGVAPWPVTPVRGVARSAAALPGVAAAGLACWGLLAPRSLLSTLGVHATLTGDAGAYRLSLLPALVTGAAWVSLLVAGRRIPPGRARLGLLVGFVVTDLLVATTTATVAVAGGSASPAQVAASRSDRPVATEGVRAVGGQRVGDPLRVGGRFVLYDPSLSDASAANAIGQPDRNILLGGLSAGGYGSIVEGVYAGVTGSHGTDGGGQDTFSVGAVAGDALDQLGTSVLLAPSSALVVPASTRTASATGLRRLRVGATATWYLGTPTLVSSVAIPAGPGADGERLAVDVQSALGGGVVGVVAVKDGTAVLRLSDQAPEAVAVSVRRVAAPDRDVARRTRPASSTLTVGPPRLALTGGRHELADGPLQGALVPPHWVYDGGDGPFAVYADRRADPGVRLVALPHGRLAGASLRVISGPSAAPDAVAVSSPGGAEVVRAVADIPGWSAQWQPDLPGEPARSLPVVRRGLVQAVTVPAGTGTLTWRYVAPGFDAGLTASLVAVGVLAVLAAAALPDRRRGAPRRRADSAG